MSVYSPTTWDAAPPVAPQGRVPNPRISVRAFQRLADQARAEQWTHEAYLAAVLAQQAADQEQQDAARRVAAANFPARKSLADFDFDRLPGLDREKLDELATGSHLTHAENVILIGPPGTGKTHLAIGLGIKAAEAGHTVRFDTAARWMTRLSDAHEAGCLQTELKRLRRYRLLVIDEVNYLPPNPNAASLFYQLVATRYEQGSLMLTSNLPLRRWNETFGNSDLVAAMVDRLAHHAEILTLIGESYRTRERHARYSTQI